VAVPVSTPLTAEPPAIAVAPHSTEETIPAEPVAVALTVFLVAAVPAAVADSTPAVATPVAAATPLAAVALPRSLSAVVVEASVAAASAPTEEVQHRPQPPLHPAPAQNSHSQSQWARLLAAPIPFIESRAAEHRTLFPGFLPPVPEHPHLPNRKKQKTQIPIQMVRFHLDTPRKMSAFICEISQ